MTYGAGIDLGTTFTAAAVSRNGDGRPEVVSLGDRAAAVPSVVLLRDDSTVLTGDAANRRAVIEPDRVAREFKRRLGDPTPLLLGGAPHSAESLQAKLLRSVYESIVQHEGSAPESVTVTFPANWGRYKQELFAQTLRMAGLEDARAYSEPVAAAVHYASNERVEPGEIVAVYDLGGGTFDAAVLRKVENDFDVMATEGLEHLGGVDFDHSVLQHVNAALGGALERLDLDNPSDRADLARLRADCAEAKEALSTDTEVTIPVSVEGKRTEVRLTRAELDEMVAPSIHETIDAMRRAIGSAGVPIESVGRILLVGGASRMPIVSRMVSSELGRPVFLDAHPKHAIALGAALLASHTSRPAPAPAPTLETPASASVGAVASHSAGGELPPPPTTGKRKRARVTLERNPFTLAVLITLIASVIGFVLFLRPSAEASGVLYQDPVTAGPSPFTQPAVDHASTNVRNVTASGPFGGTGVLTTCNKSLLKRFLNQHPDRKTAWALVRGIDVHDVGDYIDSLKSAILRVDTRVTNHGFKNGRAFELQSILAKGTAVLVDRDGEIVTRCFCGNPLTPPRPLGSSSCTGCPRNYEPPAQCRGSACYELDEKSDEQQAADPIEEAGVRSPNGGGGGSPSTQTQVSSASPSAQFFTGGATTDDDDDSTTSRRVQPIDNSNDDDEQPVGGDQVVGAKPTPTPKKCQAEICPGDPN